MEPVEPVEPVGPVEPPATAWLFPDPRHTDGEVVGVGADLEPGTLLAAYRAGIFPMPTDGVLAWWSPDPRGVLPMDGLRVSRSLRKSLGRFRVTVDAAFEEVVAACADPRRPHGWITSEIGAAYGRLHALGWAHSVEAWSVSSGELVGGLYGVAVGALFAGESMFHRETDASKACLIELVRRLREGGGRLLDVQWVTPHLASLGAVAVPRDRYLELARDAVARPDLRVWRT